MTALVVDTDGRRARPDVARLLGRMREARTPRVEDLSLRQARRVVEESISLQSPPSADAAVVDLEVPTEAGALPVRLYRPRFHDAAPTLLVYVHGGGWATGSVAVADAPCRDLAAVSGHLVASIEYRRSPETRFPGPVDDVEAAVRALATMRGSLGVQLDRLVLMGDSAGGTLVAAATPALRGLVTDQLLLYPPLSPECSTRSHLLNADDPVLPSSSMKWFWEQYLGPDPDLGDCRARPSTATDLADMPRTLVVTCQLDVLRDEGLAYVELLRSHGVDAEGIDLPGMTHGFAWMTRVIDRDRQVRDRIVRWLRKSRHDERD